MGILNMFLPLAFFFGGAPSTPEIMLVFVAILLLFGAKRLPEIARGLGKSMELFRRAARDVTDEIMKEEPKPPKSQPSLSSSQTFPSHVTRRPGGSPDEGAEGEDDGNDETAEEDSLIETSSDEEADVDAVSDANAADESSRSEAAPDEERADAGTS